MMLFRADRCGQARLAADGASPMVWAGSDGKMGAGLWNRSAWPVIGMELKGEWLLGFVCVPRSAECASWSVGLCAALPCSAD